MKSLNKLILKLLLTVLFLCCLLDMPYGYFQLVRFIGMIGFIILAYNDRNSENKMLFITWICSAVLINPIIKIPLGRTIWNVVDVIWAFILLITLIIEFHAYRKKSNKLTGV